MKEQTGKRTKAEEAGMVLSAEIINEFIEHLKAKGYVCGTIDRYEKDLKLLYESLPKDKRIYRDTLAQCREKLLEEGYAPRTVNLRISAANSLFRYLGLKEYQLDNQLRPQNENLPEITRTEYLRLLRVARSLGRERVYFLIKLFASTGIALQELPKVTVEAVKSGKTEIIFSGSKQIVRIPQCLQKELLDYASRNGIYAGSIFLARDGMPMSRSNVTTGIHQLCAEAGVPEEKGNPRCLKKLYQTTRAGIEANFDLLVEQAMERQMEAEQEDAGWQESGNSALQPTHQRLRLRKGNHTDSIGKHFAKER